MAHIWLAVLVATAVTATPATTKVETTLQVNISMAEGKCIASFPPFLRISVPGELQSFFKGWRHKSMPVLIWFDRQVPKRCAAIAAEAARKAGFRRVNVDWDHNNYALPPW